MSKSLVNTTRFFDIDGRSDMPFQLIFGARGTGKSYSALKKVRKDYHEKGGRFLYVRRTREEQESVSSEFGNPFKKLNTDLHIEVTSQSLRGVGGVGCFTENDEIIGYSVGLSSFANLRSIDLSDVNTILFDEAIAEIHKHAIKNEGTALLNLYETVNRNRELFNEDPVTLFVMANAIRLNNHILHTFNAISVIQSMIESGERRRTIPERGLYIELVDRVSIVGEKRTTALYKLGAEAFNNETLSSTFVNDDMSAVKPKVDMKHYKPYLAFGDYGIYYNANRDVFHVADAKGSFRTHLKATDGARFRIAFAPKYRILRAMDLITFKSYPTLLFMDNLLGYEVN